jgi:hypothetical protein
MSDDDFDDDDAPSSDLHTPQTKPQTPSNSSSASSRGIGLCDSPKVLPAALSVNCEARDVSSVLAQGPSNDESWGQMYRRWNALLKSFYNTKKGSYDISKVTDLADQLKFDLVRHFLALVRTGFWFNFLTCDVGT